MSLEAGYFTECTYKEIILIVDVGFKKKEMFFILMNILLSILKT